jgi:hypothetical protein
MVIPWLLACAPVIGLAANVGVQIASYRLAGRRGLLTSVVAGFAAGLVATAVVVIATCVVGEEGAGVTAAQLVLNLATAGALGYGYFHFINLGETARRVRILREFVEAGGALSPQEVLERYNAQAIVQVRLGRLLKTGQVTLRDGRYYIGRTTVLTMARIMEALKVLVLGRRSEFEPVRTGRSCSEKMLQ